MNDLLAQVMAFASALSVIVVALLNLVKATVTLPKNLIPIIGLLLGLGAGYAAFIFTDLELVPRLWAGAFAGLSATGLFELFKNNPGTTNSK
ncbi:holin [Paenibacillus sp. P3E]|uniref:holin n=1 Tax=unclassified Paenibacillus TaxID=185978 RepID=UPI0009400DEA|nr:MULTISPECIES: holin [unclassified Paenibacillus]OKP81650.1 holin [Paenibacillus sp. P3E]OKP91427.1 holin [Paenibacillus sp. P32E]